MEEVGDEHDIVAAAEVEYPHGALAVPSGPGLGLTLDEQALRAHPYQPKSYDLSMPRRSVGVI